MYEEKDARRSTTDRSSRNATLTEPPNEMQSRYSPEAQLERLFSSSTTNFSQKEAKDLIRCLCQQNTLHGMQRAEEVVERYVLLKSEEAADLMSSSEHQASVPTPLGLWKDVLSGWGHIAHKHPVAVLRMNDIMDRILQEAREAKLQQPVPTVRTKIGPSRIIFNIYLRGLARGSSVTRSAALQAHHVLNEMQTNPHLGCRPNLRSYTHVLVAYKNSCLPTAGAAVLELLEQMMEDHTTQRKEYEEKYGEFHQADLSGVKIVTPDSSAYTIALQAIVNSVGDTRRNIREFLSRIPTSLPFDAQFWATVIHAHAKLLDQEKSAAARVQIARDAELLLEKLLLIDNNSFLLSAWNSCLDAWSRVYAHGAPLECERLLKIMLHHTTLAPDTASFNTCQYAWFRSTPFHADAAQRSLELLQFQYDLGESSAQPDYRTYTIALMTQGKSNNIGQARQLLENMLSRLSGLSARPSGNPSGPFSALLSIIAKYRPPVQDGAQSLSSAIWIDTAVKVDPYWLAVSTYTEVTQDVYGINAKPNYHTFSAMLRCIAAHGTGTEKATRAHAVFDAACDAGEVSRTVVDGLFAALGKSEARQRLKDMPRIWSRNVPPSQRAFSRRKITKIQ